MHDLSIIEWLNQKAASRKRIRAAKKAAKKIKLYYHKTDGGAEYLFDTFVECADGHKEGVINNKTKYAVRIDGDIVKDAELTIK